MAKLSCNMLDVGAVLAVGWSLACRAAVPSLLTGLALLPMVGCSSEDVSGVPRELTDWRFSDIDSSQPRPTAKSEQPFQADGDETWRRPVRAIDQEPQEIRLPPWAVRASALSEAAGLSSKEDSRSSGSAIRPSALPGTSTSVDQTAYAEAADDQVQGDEEAGARFADAVGETILGTNLPAGQSGDYSIMLLVFVAPLVLLLPATWFWNLIRSYRATLPERPQSPSIPTVH